MPPGECGALASTEKLRILAPFTRQVVESSSSSSSSFFCLNFLINEMGIMTVLAWGGRYIHPLWLLEQIIIKLGGLKEEELILTQSWRSEV